MPARKTDLDAAVASLVGQSGTTAQRAAVLRKALLKAGWVPPPAVYLEGDDIPSHLPVIDHHGEVRDDYQDYDAGDGEVYTANYDVVHMNIDYDAALARERVRREDVRK